MSQVLAQSSFNNRLKRISKNPHAQPRDLVQIAKQGRKPMTAAVIAKKKQNRLVYFGLGCLWIFACVHAYFALPLAKDFLSSQEVLKPVVDYVPDVLHAALVISLVVFAFMMRKSGRAFWPMVIGSTCGFALALGPDVVMTQVELVTNALIEDA